MTVARPTQPLGSSSPYPCLFLNPQAALLLLSSPLVIGAVRFLNVQAGRGGVPLSLERWSDQVWKLEAG